MPALYLNAAQVCRVHLEGPALKVVCRKLSAQYFPLARLSRVVSVGPVAWSSAALMECLRWKVPVTLLDRDGRLVGMCFGAWPQDSPFNRLLDAFFTLDDGPERLKNWFRGQVRRRILALLAKHGLDAPDLRPNMVRRALALALKQRQSEVDPALLGRLLPLTLAQVAEVLATYQVQPPILEPTRDWRGLAAYLADLGEWAWWDLALSGELTGRLLDVRAVAACYETYAGKIEVEIRHWIGRLWRWLEQSEAYSA